ncbi:MAG: DNA-directed RNA polymerase subunit beta [Deltaproteobacteria bacterium RBG_13_65_10]|nr:MAG: DNA-directed RNA polymerase subunit beta [Deltaproteobacteria bacterium RBG_13_65_10]
MTQSIQDDYRFRRDFAKIQKIIGIPNLIEIQKRSFDKFVQADVSPEKRENTGLQTVFKSVFPIKDFNETAELQFVSYGLEEPKYSVLECQQRGMTYAAPFKVVIRLIVWDVNEGTGVTNIRDVKEQEVYFGEIPLMTDNGTFIINGTERVIVSQLHRSPGIFYDHDSGKTHSSGKLIYSARIIPYRGSWIDLEIDHKEVIQVRIDRRRKMPATILLKALGYGTPEILTTYYRQETITLEGRKIFQNVDAEILLGQKASRDIKTPKGEIVVKKGKKLTKGGVRKLIEAGVKEIQIEPEDLAERVWPIDITDPETGSLLVAANEQFLDEKLELLRRHEIDRFDVLFIDSNITGTAVRETLLQERLPSIPENILREVSLPEKIAIELFEMRALVHAKAEDASLAGRYQKVVSLWQQYRDAGPSSDPSVVLPAEVEKAMTSFCKTTASGALQPLKDRKKILDVANLYYVTYKTPFGVDLPVRDVRQFYGARLEIYRRIRPGDPPTRDTLNTFFDNLFFNPEKYDLSRVGRLKINHKLGLEAPQELGTLRREDLREVLRYLIDLKNGIGQVDDIDHLGNRRVRVVGELLENQYRIGLMRMERAIKERMSLQEIETLMPHDLINSKPVSAVVKEFFGSSQLSQFMDQTNPLSAITHKRRLSALGPGGLTRERAGFEVRDVHATHYGRICPIETPEGPNIGLIASLSTYARVNDFGFIETPYRVVKKGRVTDEVVYLSALEEEDKAIAQANAELDKNGRLVSEMVSARKSGEFVMVQPDQIDLMDVSPNQLVSVAASLIPFLEHDDANRALMGSNMQRQAVPLLRTAAPLIGTGMEGVVARDSGVCVCAKRPGLVESVDAARIVIKPDPEPGDEMAAGVDIYNMIKYQRSNQNTCINQKPIVDVGQRVTAGQVIADGPATDMGELALGQNIIVAFMPWGGYNFEDSILISERVVREDAFTSIHIEEFEIVARDTKLGKEEITRDIPNVGEEALKDLDESGIVRIGAEVAQNDILVGKITPKGETQLSPEERLLRAIFGEKAGDVRDTSLRVPPGVVGTVITARVFSRKGIEKDDRAKNIEDKEIEKILKDQEDEIKIIRESAHKKLRELLLRRKAGAPVKDEKKGTILAKKGDAITEEILDQIPKKRWKDIEIQDGERVEAKIKEIMDYTSEQIDLVKMVFDEKINRLKKGDELPPGVIKMVKVYVAIKRKLSVGDKMAGRHGNKGVLSRILPEEDMPYLQDGTPVEIILNPLGVPSRMNVGQILETHLGWAARGFGEQLGHLLDSNGGPDAFRSRLKEIYSSKKIDDAIESLDDEQIMNLAIRLRDGAHLASPVFDGASEPEIKKMLDMAQRPLSGQTILFDGRTGEPFDQDVTVGMMYMMKLHHLVDDKIHARSIGPYSLVTQQPLGGKAQFGGQRLGEMEVWAMEAYGAAYGLQEFLTVKSDDVAGRTRMYEAIVKGENVLEPGLPESFNVLVKELQSLGLDVELIEETK